MTRAFNFGAGPATLPQAVLEQVRDELLEWGGSGMSVMEMSHRGKDFMSIADGARNTLRDLLEIPEGYEVLFLQGGATAQFAAVPLNLLRGRTRAGYLDIGLWSRRAIEEAGRFCDARVSASTRDAGYKSVPALSEWEIDESWAYLHYTSNETIGGVELHEAPAISGVTLVADMSSTILSRPVDVSRFGVVYAGAQKNMGIAGLTVVVVASELLGQCASNTPSHLDYGLQAKSESMLNTPSAFAWYVAGRVFEWIKKEGGLEAMAMRNEAQASRLYDVIDASGFYRNPVDRECRSRMNVPFTLHDDALDSVFLQQAEQARLLGLKGHRSVGGMRASLYNAMPDPGVDALVDFMNEFERRHG